MIEPIRLSFEVSCPVGHAFDVWTARIAQWWPKDHTVSAEEDLTVVLEGRPGGRIYERLASGVEHDWGEVTIWEPPTRLGYTWHLKRDRADATDVEIRFVAQGDTATTVEIEHRSWERLGAEGEVWRDRNHGGWATLLPHYVAAAAQPSTADRPSAGPVAEIAHYANATLKYSGFRLDGEFHGAWEWFRADGSLMRTGQFDRGRQVGVWRTFDRSGGLVKETDFARS